MKSELTWPAGAHNNWEKCISASLSKLLVVNPYYYCIVPAILISFFITVVSAYCEMWMQHFYTLRGFVWANKQTHSMLCHERITSPMSTCPVFISSYNTYKCCPVDSGTTSKTLHCPTCLTHSWCNHYSSESQRSFFKTVFIQDLVSDLLTI